jgi:hypothetical protein
MCQPILGLDTVFGALYREQRAVLLSNGFAFWLVSDFTIFHFHSSLFTALITRSAVFLFFKVKTGVAYTTAADRAMVKIQMGFQIGLFIGQTVFFRPNSLPGLVQFNSGKPARFKLNRGACPFFAAPVA